MQWKNLHKNRSCHPLFLCQASSLSKENGTTHRFSPDWEQETADLGLCVCFCRTIWQTLWQWWRWCIMWMLHTSASIIAVLQLSWGMGVGLKGNKSSQGIGLSRLEECSALKKSRHFIDAIFYANQIFQKWFYLFQQCIIAAIELFETCLIARWYKYLSKVEGCSAGAGLSSCGACSWFSTLLKTKNCLIPS